jgi:hypothetical protein
VNFDEEEVKWKRLAASPGQGFTLYRHNLLMGRDGKHGEKYGARQMVSEMLDAQGALLSGDALHTEFRNALFAIHHPTTKITAD